MEQVLHHVASHSLKYVYKIFYECQVFPGVPIHWKLFFFRPRSPKVLAKRSPNTAPKRNPNNLPDCGSWLTGNILQLGKLATEWGVSQLVLLR